MSRRWIAFAATVVLALAGCGGPSPASDAPTQQASAPDPSLGAIEPRYTCGTFAFGPELLTAGLGHDEQANDPAAVALREQLAEPGRGLVFLPDVGWHLAGMDAKSAEFVVAGGDLGMKVVQLSNHPDGWSVDGWGDCQARLVLPPGLASAEWAFDPAQPRPNADTQTFDAMVTEIECNSGKPADGRFVGPRIVLSEDTVLVIFAVRPLAGGGVQSCPSNPSTRIRVDLGEPLGDRALWDGGRLPPGDPTKPRF